MADPNRRQTLQGLLALTTLAALPASRLLAATTQQLVVVEKDAGTLGFYALPEGRRLAALPLSVQPHEIVADPQGRFAYVAQYGVSKWAGPGAGGSQVHVIDLAARRQVRILELDPYQRLHGIRMDARGRLYVLSETSSVMIRFDHPATDVYPSQVVPVEGLRSHYFVLRRDGHRAFVADTLSGMVIMLDPQDPLSQPVRRLAGRGPEGCCLSPDESRFYVITRHDNQLIEYSSDDFRELRRVTTAAEPTRIVACPDGHLIMACEQARCLVELEPERLQETRRLPLDSPAPGLNLSPDGRQLYLGLENSHVAIMDIEQWRITHRFETAAGPDAAIVIQS